MKKLSPSLFSILVLLFFITACSSVPKYPQNACKIFGENGFKSLSDFLRKDLGLIGTKVVCAEGDYRRY